MTKDRLHKILVVEDDKSLQASIVMLLELEGYEVRAAADGHRAMQILTSYFPRVILLDMRMPVMDGWRFAAMFHERYDHRAAIIVTTAAENAKKWAEEIGAEAWLSKPFQLEELFSLVERYS